MGQTIELIVPCALAIIAKDQATLVQSVIYTSQIKWKSAHPKELGFSHSGTLTSNE